MRFHMHKSRKFVKKLFQNKNNGDQNPYTYMHIDSNLYY